MIPFIEFAGSCPAFDLGSGVPRGVGMTSLGDENGRSKPLQGQPDFRRELAADLRAHCMRMTHRGQSGHLGSMLSLADLLAVLYTGVLRIDPERPDDPG